jgi:hypothetical protein
LALQQVVPPQQIPVSQQVPLLQHDPAEQQMSPQQSSESFGQQWPLQHLPVRQSESILHPHFPFWQLPGSQQVSPQQTWPGPQHALPAQQVPPSAQQPAEPQHVSPCSQQPFSQQTWSSLQQVPSFLQRLPFMHLPLWQHVPGGQHFSLPSQH